jgi:phosphate transport system permease protein
MDKRAELSLGALSSLVLVLIAGMIAFVFAKGWPSLAHNGLAWFGPGGSVDQQLTDIFNSPATPSHYAYTFHAWPLIWATILTTFFAVLVGIVLAVLTAMFIVEFAPAAIQRLMEPVVRLLAAVPSVIYGLIGILVIVPFVRDTFISEGTKRSVEYVVQLDGTSIGVGILILTVMITPIMIAIVVDALRTVPASWSEGAAALGVNRFRGLWTISLRAARPAIIAAAVLATARALGEAIMLSMVTGSVGFSPNPLDGFLFFLEPARPLAATIVNQSTGLSVPPLEQTVFAMAAILLVSSAILSFGGSAIRRSLRRGIAGSALAGAA